MVGSSKYSIWKICGSSVVCGGTYSLWKMLEHSVSTFDFLSLQLIWDLISLKRYFTVGRWPLATEHLPGYPRLVVIPTLPFHLTWKKVMFVLEICYFNFDLRSHFKLNILKCWQINCLFSGISKNTKFYINFILIFTQVY